ncbi:spermidine synthase [Streptomyces beijiangensis]|uniref:Spermidine synthase n=1 Tax=Streptomyces beijiangensis TaxID=163361 RepID=A0A939FGN6_9ACTN|nr:spermidine synthase [Streptomyces beijiangensis]MBO0517764.1 spermidine synthase [Streptomyces beijiangensis]
MSARFEEIDWRPTPMGEISLRRRKHPVTGEDVYEVKLGDEYLMSSLFTEGEVELTRLGLTKAPAGPLDVVVGGLGLGYTARAALDDPRVRSLIVVDALADVIDWHRRGLVPLGAGLSSDPRCRLVRGDFFAMAAGSAAAGGPVPAEESTDGTHDGAAPLGLDPEAPGRRFHAILLDVDHSPRHVLHPGHAALYRPEGLTALAELLQPGGVFALWSNDPPDDEFGLVLAEVFAESAAHVVEFDNPLQGGTATNTVYVARRRDV